jgi:hypothetical protein
MKTLNIKMLMTGIALGAVIAGPALVQPARAQQMTDERAKAIQECMAMNKKNNTDPYSSTGGVEHMYQACMANKGQMR